MKNVCCLATLLLVIGAGNIPAEERAAPYPSAPAEVLARPYLFEVVRHLYRWYMDESDVERVAASKTFPFWVRPLESALDPGDRSRFAEIGLPLLGVSVKVKKADYRIEELNLDVQSGTFKIVNVARVQPPLDPPPGTVVIEATFQEMRDFLFATRTQVEFPDDALIERLRVALRRELKLDPDKREAGEQVVHLAPLSPVANECWVFWETRHLLIRFASDIDLANPTVWEHETIGVRTYDVYNQVVVSMEETAGSNAFLTRDQVGRALVNCVVLGRRLAVVQPADTTAGPGRDRQ